MISVNQYIAPAPDKEKQEREQAVLSGTRVAEGVHGVAYEPTTEEFDEARTQLRATYHTSKL